MRCNYHLATFDNNLKQAAKLAGVDLFYSIGISKFVTRKIVNQNFENSFNKMQLQATILEIINTFTKISARIYLKIGSVLQIMWPRRERNVRHNDVI